MTMTLTPASLAAASSTSFQDPHTAPTPNPAPAIDRPLVSMLLLAYMQEATVEAAVRGALAQTYSPLEIVISDDASPDGTFEAIKRATESYAGPHRLVINRNPRNLGIGAHISRMVELSSGELLFIAAGDDVSLPQRCTRVVDAWIAAGRKPDLISSSLTDVDAQGKVHEQITPTDLSMYSNAAEWLARPPHVVGAAQAWTRRVFDRFGPLPAGVVGEDLLMVFRAVTSGGAITLAEPLVQYRRGGISRRKRTLHAQDVIDRMRKNNANALVELPQLLADARTAGQLEAVETALNDRLARERFIHTMFEPVSLIHRARLATGSRRVPASTRVRIFIYAACPWLLAPFFAIKRAVSRAGSRGEEQGR